MVRTLVGLPVTSKRNFRSETWKLTWSFLAGENHSRRCSFLEETTRTASAVTDALPKLQVKMNGKEQEQSTESSFRISLRPSLITEPRRPPPTTAAANVQSTPVMNVTYQAPTYRAPAYQAPTYQTTHSKSIETHHQYCGSATTTPQNGPHDGGGPGASKRPRREWVPCISYHKPTVVFSKDKMNGELVARLRVVGGG